MIAAVAYEFAGRNFPEFILFLGMISINLAVINFLPIPGARRRPHGVSGVREGARPTGAGTTCGSRPHLSAWH